MNLFWLYAGLNYALTNSGQKVLFAFTAGGSTDADRFSAWRLGGVLPLVSELPLTLPGYYYQKLTATRFQHFYAGYDIPLGAAHRWNFRLEAATAHLEYLSGFEQRGNWQSGAGGGPSFAPKTPSATARKERKAWGCYFNTISKRAKHIGIEIFPACNQKW